MTSIEEIATRIVELEAEKKELAHRIRSLTRVKSLREKVVIPCSIAPLNEVSIAGVDGSLIKRSFHGVDLLLMRAAGVVFKYLKGKLKSVAYYPSPVPSPHFLPIFEALPEVELDFIASNERQKMEVELAYEVVQRYAPEVLLLHGPLVPHRWMESPALEPKKRELLMLLSQLLRTKSLIASVVEDSRSKKFCDVLACMEEFKLLSTFRDTGILTYVLQANERTSIFEAGSVLKEKVYSFYLKSATFDQPMRVDFCSAKPVSAANRLASILLSLTGHRRYGMPSILIEADRRARLSQRDFDLFYAQLIQKVGRLPTLAKLRRERRPF